MESTNVNKLIEYFQFGCKNSFQLGLELEHFIIDKKTKKSIDYCGDKGIESILTLMKSEFDEIVLSNNHLIGLSNSDYSISLEPAAQFEISISKQESIKNIEKIYNSFLGIINPILKQMDYELINLGYHPFSKIDDLSLLPKDRYKYMYQHFTSTGNCGKNMMKGTAATQVSIDYTDEYDFIFKYKAAMLLGPILSFITDNAPIFEGVPYEKNMLRQDIWKNVDLERTAININFKNFGFKDYADFVYNVPQIIKVKDGQILYTKKTAKDIYDKKELETKDIDLMLSMVFPDVRLKQYIEIRVADSMPFQYALSYIALIKGLFVNTASLDLLIKRLHYTNMNDVEEAKKSLSNNGYLARVYGNDINFIIDKMMNIAQQNLECNEKSYLSALIELTRGKKTLSQIYKEKELMILCDN